MRNPLDAADFVGLGRIYLSQTVWRICLFQTIHLLMWEGCEALSTASTMPQVKPHPCLLCSQNLSMQKNKKCSQHLYGVPIRSVGFSFLLTNPLAAKPQLKPFLTFPMNGRDTDHVRWVIWNRFRHKLISSHQRNAKSLPIPSTKLHHVCEINPRDTRGCQTAQRTITLLSQTKQAAQISLLKV